MYNERCSYISLEVLNSIGNPWERYAFQEVCYRTDSSGVVDMKAIERFLKEIETKKQERMKFKRRMLSLIEKGVLLKVEGKIIVNHFVEWQEKGRIWKKELLEASKRAQQAEDTK